MLTSDKTVKANTVMIRAKNPDPPRSLFAVFLLLPIIQTVKTRQQSADQVEIITRGTSGDAVSVADCGGER